MRDLYRKRAPRGHIRTAHASFRKGGADGEGQKTSPYLDIRNADKNYRPKSLR